MKLEPRLPDYLRHIQEAAEQTLACITGTDFDGLQADLRTQQAVLFNFVILGEASAKVMDGYPHFVSQHPEVPWQTMTAALPELLAQLPPVIAAAEQQANMPPAAAS